MQTHTREDIENDIEDCKEAIYQHRHALRWFTFWVRVFWLGVAIGFIVFAILTPLNIPIFQFTLRVIGGVSIALSVLVGIGVFAFNVVGEGDDAPSKPTEDHRQELREAKR